MYDTSSPFDLTINDNAHGNVMMASHPRLGGGSAVGRVLSASCATRIGCSCTSAGGVCGVREL
jgi:hypothetical protein